jgi:acetyltransferase-like isoleucine patch superfamily enzyme
MRNGKSEMDRIGPDIPSTHWMLYSKLLGRMLCRNKFKRFGQLAEFRPGAYAVWCSRISIGDRVVIRPQSMLFADYRGGGAGITIEDDALIGSAVHIYCTNHNFSNPDIPIMKQGFRGAGDVVLKSGCWIGAGAIILAGVTVGINAVVGAGSIVTRDVPSHSVVGGSPARIIYER